MSARRAGAGQQELLGSAPEARQTLLCALTPGGQIRLLTALAEGGRPLPARVEERIARAFAKGRGHGVLHLGAAELGTELDPTLGFWRELGQQFVGAVCGALDPTDPHSLVLPEADHEALCALAAAVPPMRGAELASGELLAELWADMGEALAAEAQERKTGIQGYLEAHDSLWNVVGRVCFHLAENKRDPDHPFAFIATYARQLSRQAKLQFVPLGHALQEYAGAKNRKKLLALLAPLQRSAERSELMRELVDSGDVYHPLAWTPKEAHSFLCEVER
jgi:non-specific serine/threonine protein kinase